MALDEEKYKKIFEQRFGTGSYNAGLSNARKIGQLQAQAEIAKKRYNDLYNENGVRKKSYNDAIEYWKNTDLGGKTPYQIEQDIRNDPNAERRIIDEGYSSIDEYIDGLYAGTSGGKYRSSREYEQHIEEQNQRESAEGEKRKQRVEARDKLYKDEFGETYQEFLNRQKQGAKDKAREETAKKETKKKDDKKAVGIIHDIKRASKNWFQAINPFDDVSFKEAMKNNVKDATTTERSKATKEATRALTRAGNTASFGLLNEAYKRTNDGKQAIQFTNENRSTGGKIADFGYDAAGYLINGVGMSRFLRGTPLGANMATTGLAKVGQLAKEGAVTGLGMGLGEVGVREALNPDDYTAKDNLTHIGLSTGLGAVGDPALYGAMKGIASIVKHSKIPTNTIKASSSAVDTPSISQANQEPLGLPAPQLRLPGPTRVEPTLNNFQRAFQPPQGLRNPITESPQPLKQIMNQNRLEQQGLNFGYNTKNEPKPRYQYEQPKQNQQYWQTRYEDFAKHVNDNYDMNQMTPQALEDLWTQFAKYDEPYTLDQVIDLAYPKGFEAPTVAKQVEEVAPPQQETLKDALKADPKINELAKGLFTPTSTQPPISRLATPAESFQRIQDLANQSKKVEPSLEPLQFRRLAGGMEKQFVPNGSSSIPVSLNRLKKDNLGNPFEAIGPGKTEPSLIRLKPNTTGDKTTLNTELEGLRKELKQAHTKKEKTLIRKDIVEVRGALDNIKQKELLETDKTFDDLIVNSKNWKDKPSPLLKRETMTRNFEDIMGDDAEELKKVILEPIGREEAKSIKFKTQERDTVAKFKIKGNTKDSALVQMYGEGKVSLDELKKETNNWENVVKLAEHLRKRYDELLPTMNQVLKEQGYPEVPYRKNYFPHMDDITKFQKFLKDNVGIDFEDHTLPTDINGLTGNFKPGKQFFRNSLQRKGDRTAYDAIVGFDNYLNGIGNVIYHTKNIKRLRGFEKALRNQYKDKKHLSNFVSELEQYTNMLAGKKVGFDHSTEKYTTRKVYTFVDNLRRRTASNMLGFNVSSALTSLIPSLTQAPALTGKKYFIKGMLDTMTNVVRHDGFETDFLIRRVGSDPLYRTLWDNVTDKGFWLLKTLDKFSAQTIVRGKYYELIDKGIPEQAAKSQADEFAAKIMADRSKGSMPTLFGDRTLGMLTQFQLEVNNQISIFMKDIPRMSKNKAAMASAFGQVFLYSYLFNSLYEHVTGRRPAFDPVGVSLNSIEDYNNDSISNGEATKRTIEGVANQLPFSSMFTGGRYPIEQGVPNVFDALQNKSTWKEEFAKPLTYVVPPTGGGQAKKVGQTIKDFGLNPSTGVYRTNAEGKNVMKYPIENNPLRLLQELTFGRSSLPETQDYYDNQRRELTPSQTKRMESSSIPMETFKTISKKRRLETLQNKLDKIKESKSLSSSEKEKQRNEIINQIRQLQGGK